MDTCRHNDHSRLLLKPSVPLLVELQEVKFSAADEDARFSEFELSWSRCSQFVQRGGNSLILGAHCLSQLY